MKTKPIRCLVPELVYDAIAQAATEAGVSKSTIITGALAEAHGVEFESPKRVDVARLADLMEEERPLGEIAAELGCSQSMIYAVISGRRRQRDWARARVSP